MTTLDAALLLLIVHGGLGGLDTLYCHEWQARLPIQPWAGRELRLHSIRSLLYALIFAGLAWFEWRGAYALILIALLIAEYVITLADAAEEDRSRRLSRIERQLHMVLAATTGAYMALVIYYATVEWIPAPSSIAPTEHGAVSFILTILAGGVLISGLRDAHAASQLRLSEAA